MSQRQPADIKLIHKGKSKQSQFKHKIHGSVLPRSYCYKELEEVHNLDI